MIWKTVKLPEIAKISTGKWDANHASENGKYRFYTCASKHQYSETKRFSGNCIILPGNGANVGDVYYYEGDFDAYQRTYVVHDIKISAKFLMYHMKMNWWKINKNKQYGSATNFIKIGNFNDYNVSYPPQKEQNRIVAKLDTAFAEIDKMEISLKKNEKEIKNFFDSYVLKFFKKDNPDKEIKPLKDLCENYRNDIVDGPFGSNLKSKDFTDKGVPVLKIQNVKEFLINNKKMVYVSNTKFEELKRHTFKKGDIVMTKLGEPLGVSAIVENIESGVIVADLVRIRANKINNEFLCFQLNSSENRKYINSMQKGSTRARITLSVIRELPIYCPDKSQQEKILKKIKSIKSNINKLEKIYLYKENNLKLLKNSLFNNFLIKNNQL